MSKPNNPDVAAIAERYAHAWTSHDPDAILALHAPNSTFQAHGRPCCARLPTVSGEKSQLDALEPARASQ